MTLVLLTMGFLALFFILMSVRLLLIKKGEFKGTCASQNPYLKKEGGTCGYCGKTVSPEDACGKEEEENEVNKVLSKFK
jgi:hypothetical protein